LKDGLYRDSGIDGGVARAYAQECARRAAIRNRRYSDKAMDPEANGGTIQVIERVIVKAADNA